MTIRFNNTSVVPIIHNWANGSGADDSGDYKILNPGGKVYYQMSNSYNNGLSMSNYMQAVIEVTGTFVNNHEYNYGKSIEILLSGYYIGEDTERPAFFHDIPVTEFNSIITSNKINMKSVINTDGLLIGSCVISVVNNTSNIIIIKYCNLYKSIDLNTEQVKTEINTSIGTLLDQTLLQSIDFKSTGFSAVYDNKSLEFQYMYNSSNNLIGLKSKSGKVINITYS